MNPYSSPHHLVIGQGLGPQERWSWDLEEKATKRDISVWNKALPNAEDPNFETGLLWKTLLEKNFNPETTAVLHSASAIAGIYALRKKVIQNLVLIGAWFKDPGKSPDPQGKTVNRMFRRNGIYYLDSFLNLKEKYRSVWDSVRNNIRNKILLVQSSNDPFIHLEQVEFFLDHLPKAELLMIENAGHFQYRPTRGDKPAENETLPQEVQERIFKLLTE